MCIRKSLTFSLVLAASATCNPTQQQLQSKIHKIQNTKQYCVNESEGWRQITKGFECTRWGGDPVERSVYLAAGLPVGRPERVAEEASAQHAERRERAARAAADRVEQRTEVEYDRHEDMVRVKAPLQKGGSYTYLLRAWFRLGQMERAQELGEETGVKDLEALGEPGIQLYVSARFSDWAYLDRAYSEGRRLDVTVIDRDVGFCGSYTGCTLHEDVAVNLTPGELEALAKAEHFEVKIVGNGGDVLVRVPGHYLVGFQRRLHEELERGASEDT